MGQTLFNLTNSTSKVKGTDVLQVKYVYIHRRYKTSIDQLPTIYSNKIFDEQYKISVYSSKAEAFSKIPTDESTLYPTYKSLYSSKREEFSKIPKCFSLYDVVPEELLSEKSVFEICCPIDHKNIQHDEHIAIKCSSGSEFSLNSRFGVYDMGQTIDVCPSHILVYAVMISNEIKIYNMYFVESSKSALDKIEELVGKKFEKVFDMYLEFSKNNTTIENNGSVTELSTIDKKNSIKFQIIEFEYDHEYSLF